jgi:hypothetical protein
VFFEPKLRVFEPKLRVFENQNFVILKAKLFVLQRKFVRPTEISGVDSGIFSDRNFGISSPYEVSNEVSVEWKPENSRSFGRKLITVYTMRPKELKFWLPESFGPT